jgi:GNAT superfamily N-acetyltransferase
MPPTAPALTAKTATGVSPSPSPVVAGGDTELPAMRTLRVMDGRKEVATLQYHLSAAPFATMQVLHLEVAEAYRRRGHATRLFGAAVEDARRLLGETRLRRIHTGVGHKSHLPYRALLTQLGFHHVSTTPGLYRGEDLLTYIKSYT